MNIQNPEQNIEIPKEPDQKNPVMPHGQKTEVTRSEIKNIISAELPILAFEKEIIEAIGNNQIVIITAETGAGKTTQVPKMLKKAGFFTVVTQPRRLAVRSVSKRVAQELGCTLGKEVGYRISGESLDSKDTQILFCTDGLELVRELTGSKSKKNSVLVLDEVHEWNTNMETLVAWAKLRLQEDPDFRVIIMSATMDSGSLKAFFENTEKKAPVISVPGRLFPVEKKKEDEDDIVSTTIKLAKEGKNVLVFQPGKKEIEETTDSLKKQLGDGAIILPLHGELTPEEQDRVFKKYDKPKVIVSTNVAQTSVTIPDINAVVDSGLERRIEVTDGVEGLCLNYISKADCLQRAGRSGRTQPGVYYLCSKQSLEGRDEFPKAEIERVRLDQTILRLAATGIDARKLDFFHQPNRKALEKAYESLLLMGAIDQNGNITELGEDISQLPVNVHIGRMIIEAKKRGCLDNIITIAACLEAGGLCTRGKNGERPKWRTLIPETVESDLVAELMLFEKAQKMSKPEIMNYGIFMKNFFRAKEIRNTIMQALKRSGIDTRQFKKSENFDDISICIASGFVDNVFINNGGSEYKKNGERREKAKESIVRNNPNIIIGTPFDIQTIGRKGRGITINLIQNITAVSSDHLKQVAPHLIQIGQRNMYVRDKQVTWEEYTMFNGTEIGTERKPAQVTENNIAEIRKCFADGLIRGQISDEMYEHIRKLRNESEEIHIRSAGKIRKIESEDIKKDINNTLSIHEITPLSETDLQACIQNKPKLLEDLKPGIKHFLSLTEITELENIDKNFPLSIVLNGKTYNVAYANDYWGKYVAIIYLTVEEAEKLKEEDTKVIPGGTPVNLQIQDKENIECDRLMSKSVEDLKAQILESKKRNTFYKALESLVIPSQPDGPFISENLPQLPTPIVFGEYHGTKFTAYPGYETISCYVNDAYTYKILVKYFQTKEEAEASIKKTIEYKTEVEEKIRKETEKKQKEKKTEEIKECLENFKKTFRKIFGESTYSRTPETLSWDEYSAWEKKFESIAEKISRYNSNPDPDEAEKMLENAKTEIDQYLENKKKRDEEIERGIQAGEILKNFSTWTRRSGSNQGDGWVISPDGNLRKADSTEKSGHGYYQYWNLVEKEELALTWQNNVCETVKMPAGELTQEQTEAVRKIEAELGVAENAFGLDTELGKKQGKIIDDIIAAYPDLKLQKDNFPFQKLMWPNGILLDEYVSEGLNSAKSTYLKKYRDGSLPQTECERQDATIVDTKKTSAGTLEVLVYDKWGQLNINMRIVPSTEGEEYIEETAGESEEEAKPISQEEMFEALQATFGNSVSKTQKAPEKPENIVKERKETPKKEKTKIETKTIAEHVVTAGMSDEMLISTLETIETEIREFQKLIASQKELSETISRACMNRDKAKNNEARKKAVDFLQGKKREEVEVKGQLSSLIETLKKLYPQTKISLQQSEKVLTELTELKTKLDQEISKR